MFCEKPLIWPVRGEAEEAVGEILRRAEARKITVAMNCQLPFAMEDYEKLCGKVEKKAHNHFFIRLSPASSGRKMIPDSLPHALSLLYCRYGEGRLGDLNIELSEPGEMTIRFTYLFEGGGCEVHVKLVRKEEQPRELQFGFNDKVVRRRLDAANYEIYFEHNDQRVKIEDPLRKSVASFIGAVEQKEEPFMGYGHILNNMMLLKAIDEGYGIG